MGLKAKTEINFAWLPVRIDKYNFPYMERTDKKVWLECVAVVTTMLGDIYHVEINEYFGIRDDPSNSNPLRSWYVSGKCHSG